MLAVHYIPWPELLSMCSRCFQNRTSLASQSGSTKTHLTYIGLDNPRQDAEREALRPKLPNASCCVFPASGIQKLRRSLSSRLTQSSSNNRSQKESGPSLFHSDNGRIHILQQFPASPCAMMPPAVYNEYSRGSNTLQRAHLL